MDLNCSIFFLYGRNFNQARDSCSNKFSRRNRIQMSFFNIDSNQSEKNRGKKMEYLIL